MGLLAWPAIQQLYVAALLAAEGSPNTPVLGRWLLATKGVSTDNVERFRAALTEMLVKTVLTSKSKVSPRPCCTALHCTALHCTAQVSPGVCARRSPSSGSSPTNTSPAGPSPGRRQRRRSCVPGATSTSGSFYEVETRDLKVLSENVKAKDESPHPGRASG